MIYEFLTDDGRIIEAAFPIAKAPELGQSVAIDTSDGPIMATRILSSPAAVRGDPWKPYASSRLPRNLPGVKHTPSGKPIIESRAQEREVCARFGYERE